MNATRIRWRAAASSIAVFGVGAAIALSGEVEATGPGPGGNATLPVLGVADERTVIFGAVSDGPERGTTWALRQLPNETPEPLVDGERVRFGETPPERPAPQLGFLRHTEATGWQIVGVPVRADGSPTRGPVPNARGVRMTATGAGLIVGRDPAAPENEQIVVIARNPGRAFEQVTRPDATVLLPADTPAPGDPAETLAGERGSGRINAAVADQAGEATVLIAPLGRQVEDAVLVHRAGTWIREQIVLPDAPAEFRVEAIVAGVSSQAWLAASSPGKPIRLFRRDADAGSWDELELPPTVWTDAAAAAAADLDGLAPLGGQAQTLTLSGDRLWVDVSARDTVAERTRQATLLVNPAAPLGERVRSWCDLAAHCDAPLGVAFSTVDGYRSYAWPGDGAGTRVITNPLTAPGADESNRGSWLRLSGTSFQRIPGGGGNHRSSGAFMNSTSGWLAGPVQVGAAAPPQRFSAWPASVRAPLTAIATEPGAAPGALGSGALAVGADGTVMRYAASDGWRREFLVSSSGSVVKATLRGVAWPAVSRAHAVGDLGAMWQWRADTGQWERDPATPIGFEANMMGVAFDPSDPYRGYAVGKEGVVVAYGKTWTQETLPEGFGDANFTAISFAGRQAIAVSDRGVIVNDGRGWEVDDGAMSVLGALPGETPAMVAVAGLPDGGAVLAGRTVVLIRDAAGSPWRTSAQPLTGLTAIAAAAVRDGDHVRAVVSTVPTLMYPVPDPVIDVDANEPAPLIPPYSLPGDGYVLRETGAGWRDEQHSAFAGAGDDRPAKSDPVLALALDGGGAGWAVGGWSGSADSAGRGTAASGSGGRAVRSRVQTAAVLRYSPAGQPEHAPAEAEAEIPMEGNVVRFAIGGHPQCADRCADLAPQGIAPDRMLSGALDLAQRLAARPGGPRAFLSTGGRITPGGERNGDARELRRFADLLRPRTGLPIYNAVSQGDVGSGTSIHHAQAFAGAAAPQGSEVALGISADGVPGAAAPAGAARTHYAFDTTGPGGAVRVVVIDNSAGSLADSDPHQVPAEPQEPWLVEVLDDARAKGTPTIVVGSRDLNPRAQPALNVATDGDRIAQLLVDHGASAYFFDRPEENRAGAVPAGAPVTIPSFGTGTLGYRSGIDNAASVGRPDALFGDGGFLLAEIDVAARDAATNRVPVGVRLIPVIESLSLDAVDGALLRRSRPSLFKGLGRRPVAGDRWGRMGSDGIPSPTGADPYTGLPAEPCNLSGCSTRIDPEYSFHSSAPDVVDMVAVDPATSNQRKPLLGADDKVVSDAKSGLVCPFNAGSAVVTVAAGGRAVSQTVTVMEGSVMRPCGTRPLDPSRIRTTTPRNEGAVPPPPPASPPPSVLPSLIPPPLPAPAAEPREPAPRPSVLDVPLFATMITPAGKLGQAGTVSPPPPPAGFFAQPIPPGGATVRVTEEKREQEVATEQSQAYAAITADDRLPAEPFIAALALIAALAGTTIRPGRRRGPAYARVRTAGPLGAPARRPAAGGRPNHLSRTGFDSHRRPRR